MPNTEPAAGAVTGFTASGFHAGIRKDPTKKDIALIVADKRCAAAVVSTQNIVCAAPVKLTREHMTATGGYARAIVANSGIANACAPGGREAALAVCDAVAEKIGCKPEEIIVNSTGVIGVPLPYEKMIAALPHMTLSADGFFDAAQAIMTTDTRPKEYAVHCTIGGKPVHLRGIAKGSGMIHPNMATLLGFLVTDCAITPPLLQKALKTVVDDTFNMVSVDGDTSTNDMVAILANGNANNACIDTENEDYAFFCRALLKLCKRLTKEIARDGEGATKLLTCSVRGAVTTEDARKIAKSVVTSSLVKTAVFGEDANWGRIICAMGYSGAMFDPEKVWIYLAESSDAHGLAVCRNGKGVSFDEDAAKKILTSDEIIIRIDITQGKEGKGNAVAYGCDLSYDYVKINGDYRT